MDAIPDRLCAETDGVRAEQGAGSDAWSRLRSCGRRLQRHGEPTRAL